MCIAIIVDIDLCCTYFIIHTINVICLHVRLRGDKSRCSPPPLYKKCIRMRVLSSPCEVLFLHVCVFFLLIWAFSSCGDIYLPCRCIFHHIGVFFLYGAFFTMWRAYFLFIGAFWAYPLYKNFC